MSRSRYPNADCPTCRRQIGPDDPVESCARCETTWHARCWSEQGGCGTAGCPNGPRRLTAAPRPLPGAVAGTAGGGSTFATNSGAASPSAEIGHSASSPRRFYGRPWYAAVTVVLVAAIGLTIAVSTLATQRRQAREDLARLIEEARAAGGPRQVVASLEAYLANRPSGRVARIAATALDEAKHEVDEADFRVLRELDTGADADLDQLESALRDYLTRHPGGGHRREVENRLSQLPQDRDDQAYRRADERARAAGNDIPKQKAAWEMYLREYPDGRSAAKARASIAQLPEREDDLRLARAKQELDALVKADRLTEALLRVDRGLAELRTASRQQRLAEVGRQVEAKLEEIDAARCLQPVGSRPSDREQRLSECRLYLLCYPAGANREKIEAQIRSVLEAQHEEEVRQLRRKLDALQDNPDDALRVVAEWLRDASISASKLTDDVVRLHGARLRRLLDGSLANMKSIRLNDGTELVGTVKAENSTSIQLDLRSAGAGGPRRNRLLARTQIASIADPPARTEWERIREHWPERDSRKLTAPKTIEEVRSLRGMVAGDEYRPEWEACQVFLAALDSADRDARETAARLGFVENGGALLPGLPLGTAASGQHDRRQVLERSAASFRPKATTTAQGFLSRLPNTYEFTLYSTGLDVPVKWSLGGCSTDLQPTDAGELVGSARFRFPLTLSRDGSLALPDSVAERVDREIGEINRQIEFEIEYEVRAVPSRARGIGVQLENRGDDVVVKSVVSGTPAEAAGILAGDRLCRVGDEWVEAGQRADSVAARFTVSGRSVSLVVVRQDRRFLVDVELREFDSVSYQARDRLDVRVDMLGKRVSGHDWSEWTTMELSP